MDTPICDFVRRYTEKRTLRAHMPGHKGASLLGFEEYDITEIVGADSLYEAEGIIRKSEQNASYIFGCPTFYSTEGSSQCIRAMLYLAVIGSVDNRPLIAAGRNAHKTFISAATLLDFDIDWLCSECGSYLSCDITPEYLEKYLNSSAKKPAAVYITSPDYLGNMLDVGGIAKVCHTHSVMLLVDNAHGAYLRFLPESLHPMDMGADMCCSSAHKTLPVLTGGAYLHISPTADPMYADRAKSALAMFGSTSPSYLILQSLDMANSYLEGHTVRLGEFIPKVAELKNELTRHGYGLAGDEPMKVTVSPKSYGYTGDGLAAKLEASGIMCEFSDPDHLVMMLTPETGDIGISQIMTALRAIPRRERIDSAPPSLSLPRRCMSPRNAAFSPCEIVSTANAAGRILASAEVGCPPAVPIVVCGEEVSEDAVRCFEYYGIEKCTVVAEM